MNSNTILSWDGTEHKTIYTRQLKDNPIYWNDDINAWVVYSYEFCKAILTNADAQIPAPIIADALSDKAKSLLKNLARLSNNDDHEHARRAALLVFESMKSVSVGELLATLLKEQDLNNGFDWVGAVAKKLPVLVILKGLGFSEEDCAFVVDNIATQVKIMSAAKIGEDIAAINSVVDKFYAIGQNHIEPSKSEGMHDANLFICNLIGLFIQSYDAGRGLLTNTLINMVRHHEYRDLQLADIRKIVTETLRFDPPVHNTRRVAVKDIFIGDKLIKASDTISIVMAAANLDPSVFADPLNYTADRTNNDQHLTFGLGGHNCIAKYFSVDLAVQVCAYLAANYTKINIIQNEFTYEPALNVRLVKQLTINLL